MSKILYIDDNKNNLTVLSSLLKNIIPGCTVFTALSGPEGIKKAKAEPPDSILLDIKMPNMDGMELLKYLRDRNAFKAIPIVMLTTESEFSTVIEAKKEGVNAWIIKPFAPTKLTDTEKNFLQ